MSRPSRASSALSIVCLSAAAFAAELSSAQQPLLEASLPPVPTLKLQEGGIRAFPPAQRSSVFFDGGYSSEDPLISRLIKDTQKEERELWRLEANLARNNSATVPQNIQEEAQASLRRLQNVFKHQRNMPDSGLWSFVGQIQNSLQQIAYPDGLLPNIQPTTQPPTQRQQPESTTPAEIKKLYQLSTKLWRTPVECRQALQPLARDRAGFIRTARERVQLGRKILDGASDVVDARQVAQNLLWLRHFGTRNGFLKHSLEEYRENEGPARRLHHSIKEVLESSMERWLNRK